MKTHLRDFISAVLVVLLGTLTAESQNYFGIPFGGTATQIGANLNQGYKLEFENFDAVENNSGGANYDSSNPVNGVVGTYYDRSPLNGGNSNYRTNTDVDIDEFTNQDSSTGYGITGNQGQEFQMYTIDVQASGEYFLTINYKHGAATNKRYQIYLLDPADVETSLGLLWDTQASTNPDLLPATGAVFADSEPSQPFTLNAGTYIIRTRSLDAGPVFNYMTFTRTTTLGINDEDLANTQLRAYPNPARNGQFKLNMDTSWSVYSMLGVKLLEGSGEQVDLSDFATGTYVLKTPHESRILLSN